VIKRNWFLRIFVIVIAVSWFIIANFWKGFNIPSYVYLLIGGILFLVYPFTPYFRNLIPDPGFKWFFFVGILWAFVTPFMMVGLGRLFLKVQMGPWGVIAFSAITVIVIIIGFYFGVKIIVRLIKAIWKQKDGLKT